MRGFVLLCGVLCLSGCDQGTGGASTTSGGEPSAEAGAMSDGGSNGDPGAGGSGASSNLTGSGGANANDGGAGGDEPAGGGNGGSARSTGGDGEAGAGGDGAAASTGGTEANAGTGSGGAETAGPGATLAERFPGDVGIEEDESVLFFDDFETGWGRWDAPGDDTQYLHIETDEAIANAGERYLRSTVTVGDLEANEYISAAPDFAFDRSVDAVHWRFYARFPVIAPNPHHWIRTEAGNEGYASSGLANTVPAGDEGFWFDFDITNDDVFNFYTYWYGMRSGRCNDGSATPGCEGDQGTTYHYGNVFQPREQTAFARDEWICVELGAGANTVGESDGWLAFWVNDVEIGRYAPGEPSGTWLRDSFHEGGCDFSACTPPMPFEGFDFRSAPDLQFKRIILDAYYERGSSADKRTELEARGLTLSDEQTIYYDDIVVATTRIGCRR